VAGSSVEIPGLSLVYRHADRFFGTRGIRIEFFRDQDLATSKAYFSNRRYWTGIVTQE